MDESKPAQRVGDYEFLDLLAVGGMGRLWRVRHVKLGAIYVAKELRADLRGDPEFAKRFLHEAQLVANFRHPNVVQVFGYDEEHMLYFMEYVEGMDLDKLLRSGHALEFAERRCIIEVVADTIGHAHREFDLIHRDIKPSNVLIAIAKPEDPIERSRIKLTDFGIARVLSVNQRVTMSSGMVMGTVHYMAPEQFEGQANKPSDVYSIGVLYYQLLTGRTPFDGPTAFVIRDKHLHEIPRAPHEIDPSIPLDDSLIVMKCLEKDPANRFQDGAELSEALIETRPTSRTVTMPIPRTKSGRPSTRVRTGAAPAPAAGEEAPEGPAVPTALMPGTQRTRVEEPTGATIAPPVGEATRRTMPARVEMPTSATLAVPKPRTRLSRALRAAAIAVGALAAVLILAALIMRPRYEIRWSTLRSDPLDTPSGIHVAICPSVGHRLFWWPVGTVADQAPPNWANWTTWFDTIDVRFSDGFYRQFVLTCRKGEDVAYVDFGGATFEQLAEARKAQIVENPARVGDYINAALTPQSVAMAKCLPDARTFVDRVGGLLDRAGRPPEGGTPNQEGRDLHKARLDAYRSAVASLAGAAEALADGRSEAAEACLGKAKAAIQEIGGENAASLPKDFLFRETLATAIAQLKDLEGKADRHVKGLDLLFDSISSLQSTVKEYRETDAAVAQYVLFAPGRTAFNELMKKGGQDPASLEVGFRGLGGAAPPPVVTLQSYLAKLDALILHKAGKELDSRCRTAALMLLDVSMKAAKQAERSPWVDACFAKDDRSFLDAASALWLEAHRRRFADALRLCMKAASDNMAKAAALPAGSAGLREAMALFDDAEGCLQGILRATHATKDDQRAASVLLSVCSVKHALCLFALGPDAPGKAETHVARVRQLLDRGLAEPSVCPPEVAEEGRALKEMLKSGGGASAKLAACCRDNFAEKGAFGGSVRTLFDALDAYERLAVDLKAQADRPLGRAVLAPFTDLPAESCKGFTLPNAAACWLLANAAQSCEKGKYAEACGFLRGFVQTPGDEGKAESPLKRLLAPELAAKAVKLAGIAASFDETQVPAEGPDAAARWKKLWDSRLEAKPSLDLDIPQTVAAALLPPSCKGQEEQWTAVYAKMRELLAHYRNQILAEEVLRQQEAEIGKLVIREGGTVRPNPATASPDAVQKCSAALDQLKEAGPIAAEDHASRVASLRRDLTALGAKVTGLDKRIEDLLGKGDFKAALDELATWKAAVGKTGELDLTRQALTVWVKQATKEIDDGKFDLALAKFQAIQQHEQPARHSTDPAIKAALDDAAKALAYCDAQRLLGLGPQEFAAALGKLRLAAPYRDSETLGKQIAALQKADQLKAANPFEAWSSLSELAKDKDLRPKMKETAERAAREIRTTLARGAADCAKAFDGALAKGAWEPFVDPAAVSKEQVDRLKAFLGQVDALDVQEVAREGDDPGELRPDKKEIALTRKRVLKFGYLLPGQAKLPVTVEQSIRWTLRYVPPEEQKDRSWVIVSWEDTQ